MGRKSIAQSILDGITGTDDDKAVFLVAYDFRKMNASTRFYENLHRIAEKTSSGLVQYSVFMTRDRKSAIAVAKLAEHYGAEAIVVQGDLLAIH
jgi:hypothetical protein